MHKVHVCITVLLAVYISVNGLGVINRSSPSAPTRTLNADSVRHATPGRRTTDPAAVIAEVQGDVVDLSLAKFACHVQLFVA